MKKKLLLVLTATILCVNSAYTMQTTGKKKKRQKESTHSEIKNAQEKKRQLMKAAQINDIITAKKILKEIKKDGGNVKAFVNLADNCGRTALHYAAACKLDTFDPKNSMLALLLDAGANIDAQDNKKNRALYSSIQNLEPALKKSDSAFETGLLIVYYLLSRGASRSVCNNDKLSPENLFYNFLVQKYGEKKFNFFCDYETVCLDIKSQKEKN